MAVLGKFPIINNVVEARLAVVREVEDMKHVVFLLQDHFPAVVNNRFEPECLMILFPAMTDENGIRLRERDKLEL